MRKLILLLFATISLQAQAIGPEQCALYGSSQGKTVTLEFIGGTSDDAYGTTKDSIYGYCIMGAKCSENLYFMSCSTKAREGTTAYYELDNHDTTGSAYLCRSGCGQRVVKRFRLECLDGLSSRRPSQSFKADDLAVAQLQR
jgi:hypothetical protein